MPRRISAPTNSTPAIMPNSQGLRVRLLSVGVVVEGFILHEAPVQELPYLLQPGIVEAQGHAAVGADLPRPGNQQRAAPAPAPVPPPRPAGARPAPRPARPRGG